MSSTHDDTSDKENKDKKNEDSRGRTRRRTDSHSSRSSGSSGRSSSSGSDSSSGSSSSGSSSRSGSRSSRSSSSSSSVAADVSTSDVKQKIRQRSVSRSPRRSVSVRKSRSPEKRNLNHSRRSLSRSPDRKNRKDDLKRGKPSRNNAEADHRARSPSPKRRRKRTPSPKPPRVYLSKLTRNVHKEHVNEIFSNYGQIKFIEMPTFRQFQGFCNKGFAYVEFETLESANKALRMDGGQIDGQEVSVELADYTHQPSDLRKVRSPPRHDYFPRGGRGWRRGPPRFFPRGRMRSPPTRRWSPPRQSRRRSRSPVRHRQYSRSSSGDSR